MTAGDASSRGSDDPRFLADYQVLRTATGAVTLRRDVLSVSGADAVEYLQGQLSQDIAALVGGESADSLILTPQGKLDALVRVTRTGDDAFVLDVDGGFGEQVAARLARFKLRVKVVIEPLPWGCVALRGPRTAEGETAGTSLIAAFSWNGVSGIDLLGEAPHVPEGVPVCSLEAWESVRVEAGIPVMGAELDERTIAAEADLLERCVSFTKGCYTGQELVARLDARGNRVARHLRGLVVVGLADSGASGTGDDRSGAPAVAPGFEIVSEGKVVGTVTSSAWSPSLDAVVALGYVHRTVTAPSIVAVRPPGGNAVDDAVAASVAAEVRALPLV